MLIKLRSWLMVTLLLMILSWVVGLREARCADPWSPQLTPGAATGETNVCVKGFARTHRERVRPTLARALRYQYHVGPSEAITFDHLIPVELGGASVEQNIWPEDRAEAKQKDVVENRMKRAVCAGRVPLARAQLCFTKNWRTCEELIR